LKSVGQTASSTESKTEASSAVEASAGAAASAGAGASANGIVRVVGSSPVVSHPYYPTVVPVP